MTTPDDGVPSDAMPAWPDGERLDAANPWTDVLPQGLSATARAVIERGWQPIDGDVAVPAGAPLEADAAAARLVAAGWLPSMVSDLFSGQDHVVQARQLADGRVALVEHLPDGAQGAVFSCDPLVVRATQVEVMAVGMESEGMPAWGVRLARRVAGWDWAWNRLGRLMAAEHPPAT